MAFPSRSDELSAVGNILNSSAALGGIIIAVLIVAPELRVPAAVLGLLKVAAGASLVATIWSLSDMFWRQDKTWLQDWRSPYSAMALGLILFVIAYLLIQFPGLSEAISSGFSSPGSVGE